MSGPRRGNRKKGSTGWSKRVNGDPGDPRDDKLIGVYRCDFCSQLFNTDPSQTVASTEAKLEEDFNVSMEELAERDVGVSIVCDSCYKQLAPEISGAL